MTAPQPHHEGESDAARCPRCGRRPNERFGPSVVSGGQHSNDAKRCPDPFHDAAQPHPNPQEREAITRLRRYAVSVNTDHAIDVLTVLRVLDSERERGDARDRIEVRDGEIVYTPTGEIRHPRAGEDYLIAEGTVGTSDGSAKFKNREIILRRVEPAHSELARLREALEYIAGLTDTGAPGNAQRAARAALAEGGDR